MQLNKNTVLQCCNLATKALRLQLAQICGGVASLLKPLVQYGSIFWHQPFSMPSFFESILGVHLPVTLTISNCSGLSLNELHLFTGADTELVQRQSLDELLLFEFSEQANMDFRDTQRMIFIISDILTFQYFSN